jgi:hypothetical protein
MCTGRAKNTSSTREIDPIFPVVGLLAPTTTTLDRDGDDGKHFNEQINGGDDI